MSTKDSHAFIFVTLFEFAAVVFIAEYYKICEVLDFNRT